MPIPIYGIVNPRTIMLINKNRPLFEISSYILEILDIFNYIIKSFLNFTSISFNNDFDNSDIHKKF